jgi:hypothetical protein
LYRPAPSSWSDSHRSTHPSTCGHTMQKISVDLYSKYSGFRLDNLDTLDWSVHYTLYDNGHIFWRSYDSPGKQVNRWCEWTPFNEE